MVFSRWILSLWCWSRSLASLHEPVLADILPIQILQHFLENWGYLVVLVFALIESMGVPFPGETMLLFGAFVAAVGHLSIYGVIAAAAAGAILGDNLGYWIGRKGGRPFVQRFGHYFFVREEHLDAAERYFARHGDKTVFFGRFISILRTWAAFLAGVNKMRWPVFLFYNAAGGILWAILYGVLGYFVGRVVGIRVIERYSRCLGYGVIAVIVLVVAVFIFRHWRASHKRRERSIGHSDTEAANDTHKEPSDRQANWAADDAARERAGEQEKVPPA